MNNTTQSHPSGGTLYYNDRRHIYYMQDKPYDIFTSVTTYIKQFFPEFDTETISRNYAKKYRLNQEDVKKQWRDKRIRTSKFGNLCHDYSDHLMKNGNLLKPRDKRDELYFNYIKKEIKSMLKYTEVVGSEYIIASPKLNLGGSIDLIVKDDLTVYIIDWKIVGEIKQNNIYQTASRPISHLDDCNYNKYSLQLNIYKYILIEEDYFPEIKNYKMIIKHITDEGCINFQVSDMTKEVKKMIEFKKV